MKTFSELGLSKQILTSLQELGFDTPTEIQAKAIGVVLAGHDMIASAETGSGKTAAYALPLIERLGCTRGPTRALVIVPTRELALQVTQQLNLLAKYFPLKTVTLYGGVGFERQRQALHRGADIIVATPGRLLDCISKGYAKLSGLVMLVLDEADRLLDMGFTPQVRKVVASLPKKRQTLMFSATVDRRIEQIASEFLQKPVSVKSDSKHIEPAAINQKIIRVHEFGKDALLLELLEKADGSVLVFASTRRKVKWVTERLRDAKVLAKEIHGEINQSQREKTLSQFRQQGFSVLVATDIAARGLDIPSISHVINYDVPQSPEDYVHRIGRTGRAGRSGTAITLVSDDQRYLLGAIEKIIGKQLDPNATPTRRLAPGRFRRPARQRA